MRLKISSIFLLGAVSSQLAATEDSDLAWKELSYALHRSETLPADNFQDATDPYLEGYIQALVDVQYSEHQLYVSVKDHVVYLANLPQNPEDHASIKAFVADIPGVTAVESKELSPDEKAARAAYVEIPPIEGTWFPQSTVLFSPIIGDPREPISDANYRWGDHVVGKSAAAVSYCADFPIFRWRDVGAFHGDLQLGVTAGVYTVFNYTPHNPKEECEMVNADYMGGLKLDYALDSWAFRSRIYHISSHLGDEFLANGGIPLTDRTNPSFEALDLFASYQISESVRGYGGAGWIFHSDETFPMDNFYFEYGLEVRNFGWKNRIHQLYGSPFLAVNISNWQVRNWGFNFTAKAGYELSKLQGVGRKIRFVLSYHKGYSAEGQFFKMRTQFYEVGASWGF